MSDTRPPNEPPEAVPAPEREDPTRDVDQPWAPSWGEETGASPYGSPSPVLDSPGTPPSPIPPFSAAPPPPAAPPPSPPAARSNPFAAPAAQPVPAAYGQGTQDQPAYGLPAQPGQPYPPYGPPPPYAPGSLGKPYGSTSGRATAVLVLGIAAIPCLFLCGAGFVAAIVALALAPGANREIRDSGGALTGEGQVRAGRILAVVALVLGVLTIVGYAVFFAVALSHGGTFTPNGSYS